MTGHDDALHDERCEQATERATAPYPPGEVVRGTWYPPGQGPEADDEEDRDYADLIDERNAEWWADHPDPWPEHAAVVAAIHDRCASRTDACTTEPPF